MCVNYYYLEVVGYERCGNCTNGCGEAVFVPAMCKRHTSTCI